MELSIIVPVYRETKNLERFLNRVSKQTSENYELILVVDTSNDNSLEVIDSYFATKNSNLKIIYNSRRQGRYNAIKKAAKIAAGEYAIITSTSNLIKEDFVKKINHITKAQKIDIIEFSARSHSPIRFQGRPRKKIEASNKRGFSEQKKDVFAYTYPFAFNKIIKMSVLKKATSYLRINTQVNNSRFSIEIIFKCILFASSYLALEEKIVRLRKNNDTNYNPIGLLKEWNKIIKNEMFFKYKEALEYNRNFSSVIIYKAYNRYLKKTGSQVKFNTFFKTTTTDNFYDLNTYYLKDTAEANILREYKNIDSHKAYKEL